MQHTRIVHLLVISVVVLADLVGYLEYRYKKISFKNIWLHGLVDLPNFCLDVGDRPLAQAFQPSVILQVAPEPVWQG